MKILKILHLFMYISILCSCSSLERAKSPCFDHLIVPYDASGTNVWVAEEVQEELLEYLSELQSEVLEEMRRIHLAEVARADYIELLLGMEIIEPEGSDSYLGATKAGMLDWDEIIRLYEQLQNRLSIHRKNVGEDIRYLRSKQGF